VLPVCGWTEECVVDDLTLVQRLKMSRKRAKRAQVLPDVSSLVPDVSKDPESVALDEKVHRFCEMYRNSKLSHQSKKRRAQPLVWLLHRIYLLML
jgi:hypothetical protein